MKRYTICFFVMLSCAPASAEQWPNWRGPFGTGVAPAGDFPIEWSKDQNVAWKFDLPGKGASTPAVWDDSVFVTCGLDGKNGLLCLNRAGNLQWQVKVGEERAGKHKKATGSNSSPVTDGERVYVYFKSGDLACVDFSGKTLWHHNLQEKFGEDTLWWDLGTSAVLTKANVVVACMQSDNSYVVAFDRRTGEVAWKQDRNTNAPEEANQSYTTPQVVDFEGTETIVIVGGDYITAHDAADGSELWRVGSLNPEQNKYFRSISSPVVADGIVVAPYARGESLTAVRLGGEGDVTDSHVIWTKDISSDVPTPAAANGQTIVLTDKGQLLCLNVESGKQIWEYSLPKSRAVFSSSPVLVGDYLFATREDGTTYVLKVGGENVELVATNELDEFTVATPVFSNGQLFVRTEGHLYCFVNSGS